MYTFDVDPSAETTDIVVALSKESDCTMLIVANGLFNVAEIRGGSVTLGNNE